MRESAIQQKILDYLRGLPECYARKIHGSIYGSGIADILGVYRGRALVLEVKQDGKKATPLQARELDRWHQGGAIVGVVCSVDDVQALLHTARTRADLLVTLLDTIPREGGERSDALTSREGERRA
jgi:hypothetical protein